MRKNRRTQVKVVQARAETRELTKNGKKGQGRERRKWKRRNRI
jgi:hypothetical protein